MPASVEPFQDSPAARAELAPFLVRSFQGEGQCTEALWLKRMAHWWDENPFVNQHPCRGWALRSEDRLVGYLGAIPGCYEDGVGNLLPALIATTWAVDQEHRTAAMAMGWLFQRQGQNALLVDTTPSPKVQRMLQRWGWKAETAIRRRFLLRGSAWWRAKTPALPSDLRIINNPALVTAIRGATPRGQVHKHITPAYLQWYVRSPMREHHFLGVVDEAGQLSSYLMVTPQRIKKVPAWAIVDWFTIREGPHELHALVSALAQSSCGLRGCWWPLLSLASFASDDLWHRLPKLHERIENVCHFHWLPPDLKSLPKSSVLAEGDWGL